MNKVFFRSFFSLLLISVFVSCTGIKEKSSSDPEPMSIPSEDTAPKALPPVETQVFYMKPVVKKLLKKAKLKTQEKNYHAAVNLLEMAIDISPNNPYTWQQLALVRLRQENYRQAEQLATKSNVLGEENNDLRMKNWQIIAEAKRGQKKP